MAAALLVATAAALVVDLPTAAALLAATVASRLSLTKDLLTKSHSVFLSILHLSAILAIAEAVQ